MVIAALACFATLLVAWVLAPEQGASRTAPAPTQNRTAAGLNPPIYEPEPI